MTSSLCSSYHRCCCVEHMGFWYVSTVWSYRRCVLFSSVLRRPNNARVQSEYSTSINWTRIFYRPRELDARRMHTVVESCKYHNHGKDQVIDSLCAAQSPTFAPCDNGRVGGACEGEYEVSPGLVCYILNLKALMWAGRSWHIRLLVHRTSILLTAPFCPNFPNKLYCEFKRLSYHSGASSST